MLASQNKVLMMKFVINYMPFFFFSGGAEEETQWGKCPTSPWY
jgi:hypothetical protein